MSAVIGSRIGQYRIAREIARGGMGVIYEAVHDEIGRRAAIKVLSPDVATDPGYVRRFLKEARAISSVSHPGLVQIYDFGQTSADAPYMLMELLEGETLRVRMTRAPRLEIAEIRRVTRQIAAALAATHEQGIVHRDLKPENVMFVPDDEAPGGERIKLLDFGIARFFASHDATLTAPGVALGTIAYMSPEQCVGDANISGAADVYSLGAMLYELLGGAPPFAGPSGSAVMRMHVTVAPPPLPPDGPPDLAALAMRMLAKEPTLRPSMREIVATLLESADHRTWDLAITSDYEPATTARRSRLPTRHRRRWVALIAAVAGASAQPAGRTIEELDESLSPPPPTVANMIWLRGGAFRMGRTAEEIERECKRVGDLCDRAQLDSEQPVRDVMIAPYYLDKFEATNEEVAYWLAMMSPSLALRFDTDGKSKRWIDLQGVPLIDIGPPYAGIEHVDGGGFRALAGAERKPVVQLTWDGASLYCKSRGKRLPTEAEWEFAARGITARRFPWGDLEPSCDGVVWGRESNKPCAAHVAGPTVVGTAPLDRTPEGVHDLGGNVREWVFDQFQLLYPSCGACSNPRVEATLALTEDVRVVRGGSWAQGSRYARSTARGSWNRAVMSTNGGARCAR